RAARTAVGVGRHGVGEYRARPKRRGGYVVGAGDQPGPLAERRQRYAAGTHVADVQSPHGEEASVGAERQLALSYEVPSLIVAQEGLGPRGGVFDRAAKLAGRPQDEAEFDIGSVSGAKVSADVIGMYPQAVRGYAEHRSQLVFLADGAAASGVEGVALRRRIVTGQRR